MEEEGSTSNTLCKICFLKDFVYICPRCGINYCSLQCYKSPHHANCSEAFYKDCVEEEMSAREVDPESKQRMLEILKRINEESDMAMEEEVDEDDIDGEDEEEDLSKRLEGVNLDDADQLWERLTEEERGEFLQLIKSGSASKLIPVWDPWWSEKREKPKILETGKDWTQSYKAACPAVKRQLPPLPLTSKPPSPLIYYNLLNVLGSYCVASRYYNGQHSSQPLEFSTTLIALSKTLSSKATFDSLETALESVRQEALSCTWVVLEKDNLDLIKVDVPKIVDGPNKEDISYYVKAALSDILANLAAAKKEIDSPRVVQKGEFFKVFPDDPARSIPLVGKETLKLCKKKIEYYLSWSVTHLYNSV